MPRKYDTEQIERGLQQLALCDGNAAMAHRRLQALGQPTIPRTTLTGWLTSHADRYAEIQREIVPLIREGIARQNEALIIREGEIEGKLVERLDKRLEGEPDAIPARDLPGAVRNLAVARGVNTDKASTLRGQPTEITEHRRDFVEIQRALEAKGISVEIVEGTAKELPPASPNGDDKHTDLDTEQP